MADSGSTLVPATAADPLVAAGKRSRAPGWPHPDSAVALGFTATGGQTYLIVDHAGAVAGECGTKGPATPDGVVEIGYGLAGPSRGRGLGGRAVAALLELLAEQPEVRVVEAHVDPDNTPSRRLLERLGFDLVGTSGPELVYRRALKG